MKANEIMNNEQVYTERFPESEELCDLDLDQVSGGFVLTAAGVIGAGMVAAGVCCVSGYAMAKYMKRV